MMGGGKGGLGEAGGKGGLGGGGGKGGISPMDMVGNLLRNISRVRVSVKLWCLLCEASASREVDCLLHGRSQQI